MTTIDTSDSNPLPTAVWELCPEPCKDGDPCFCSLGFCLIYDGAEKIRKKYPAMTIEQAAPLIVDMVVNDASSVAGADEDAEVATKLVRKLIQHAVNLAFHSCFGFSETANMSARINAELHAHHVVENVLSACVRDFQTTERNRRTL